MLLSIVTFRNFPQRAQKYTLIKLFLICESIFQCLKLITVWTGTKQERNTWKSSENLWQFIVLVYSLQLISDRKKKKPHMNSWSEMWWWNEHMTKMSLWFIIHRERPRCNKQKNLFISCFETTSLDCTDARYGCGAFPIPATGGTLTISTVISAVYTFIRLTGLHWGLSHGEGCVTNRGKS